MTRTTRYRTSRWNLPEDLKQAANTGPRFTGDTKHITAQEAVDAARAYVNGFSSQGLPRAEVWCKGKKGNWMIFRVWRGADGRTHEEAPKQ